MNISKSDYMLYLKQPAWLWLKKHDKDKLPAVGPELQAIFDQGHEFEGFAERLFPEGERLGFADFSEYRALTKKTKEALDDGAETIFQGRFQAGDFTFICDVLQVVAEGVVDLYEIKSSTKVKSTHIYDLAFQREVLTRAGYEVRDIYVVHVNKGYVREGAVEPEKLTAVEKVTEKVAKRTAQTTADMEQARKTAGAAEMPDPAPHRVSLGAMNEWVEIYRGLVDVPEHSVYDLNRVGAKRLKAFSDAGVEKITDIDTAALAIDFTDKQTKQIQATQSGAPVVEPEPIKTFLQGLTYPLYFLDYETMMALVPAYEGTSPYEQIPVQYSLHVLYEPGGELTHHEYLHTDGTSPAEDVSKHLAANIGAEGTVLVWYESFEKSCNTKLARLAPAYEEFYEGLNDRIVDLMTPFAQGHYVDRDFHGSCSIKSVLPVLAPEFSYAGLAVSDGQAAQRLWVETVLADGNEEDREEICADLLEYCRLDTLAMVEIYRFLEEKVAGPET